MSRRKDGLLEKSVTIGGKRVHVYGHNEREIREKINELYDEQYKGITSDMPFKDYAEHWLEITLVDKSVNTQVAYSRATEHLIEELGSYPLGMIKRSEIEKALNLYSDRPTTRNRMLSMCLSIYNMAVDDGLCSYNPAFNIKKLKPERKMRDRLTQKEIYAVKNAQLDDCARLFLDVLYYTGARRGEALAITRKSIGDGVLKIREQIVWDRPGNPIASKLKTRNAARDIPIPKDLEKRLREFCKKSDTIYLFDRMLRKSMFRGEWLMIKYAIYAVDHPDFKKPTLHNPKMSSVPIRLTPHFFRHNFASILYDNNVDVKTAQILLGHASINTTLGIYTHLSKDSEKDDYDAIRNITAAM